MSEYCPFAELGLEITATEETAAAAKTEWTYSVEKTVGKKHQFAVTTTFWTVNFYSPEGEYTGGFTAKTKKSAVEFAEKEITAIKKRNA